MSNHSVKLCHFYKLVVSGGGGGGEWEWEKWVKGSGRERFPVMKRISCGNERYPIRNIANGIVTALYDDRW